MNYKHVDCKNEELKICLEYIANFRGHLLNNMNYNLLANMLESNLESNIIKAYIESTMKNTVYEFLFGEDKFNSHKEDESNILLDKLKKAYLEKNIDLEEKVCCEVLKFILSKWEYDEKEPHSHHTKSNLKIAISNAVENFVDGSFASKLICSLEYYSSIMPEEDGYDYYDDDDESYLTEDDFNPYGDYGWEIENDDYEQTNNKQKSIIHVEQECFCKSLYMAILDNRYELNNLLDYSCLVKENKKRLNENKIKEYVEMPDFGDDK